MNSDKVSKYQQLQGYYEILYSPYFESLLLTINNELRSLIKFRIKLYLSKSIVKTTKRKENIHSMPIPAFLACEFILFNSSISSNLWGADFFITFRG